MMFQGKLKSDGRLCGFISLYFNFGQTFSAVSLALAFGFIVLVDVEHLIGSSCDSGRNGTAVSGAVNPASEGSKVTAELLPPPRP